MPKNRKQRIRNKNYDEMVYYLKRAIRADEKWQDYYTKDPEFDRYQVEIDKEIQFDH